MMEHSNVSLEDVDNMVFLTPSPTNEAELDIFRTFNTSSESVSDLLHASNKHQTEIKAFFGDLVLKSCVTNHVYLKLKDAVTVSALHDNRIRYESNAVLALFLMEGTNLTEYFKIDERSLHYFGTIFEALLWDFNKNVDKNMLDVTEWVPVVDILIRWIDSNVSSSLIHASTADVDTMCITPSDKTICEEKDLDFSQLVQIFRKERDVDKKNSHRPSHDLKRKLIDDLVFSLRDSREDISSMQCRELSGVKFPVDCRAYDDGYCFTFEQRILSVTEARQKMSSMTMDSEGGYDHLWTDPRSHHTDVDGNYSHATWYGKVCRACKSFFVRRKMSNKKSSFFLLGLEGCPGNSVNWIEPYRKIVHEKLMHGELGRMNANELESWGFLRIDED